MSEFHPSNTTSRLINTETDFSTHTTSDVPAIYFTTTEGEPAPTYDADELLSMRIVRDSLPLMNDRFSQTPLDPFELYEQSKSTSYMPRSIDYLQERIDTVALNHRLPEEYRDMIFNEVMVEHERRCEGNKSATGRLAESLRGQTLDRAAAELIWRARVGDATMLETGQLLLRHPEMLSVEAAKYTQPLDPKMVLDMEAHLAMRLSEMRDDPSLQLGIYHDKVERDPRFIATENSGVSMHIVALKDNIGELTNGDATIQLVRKHTAIMLPPSLQLPGVSFNPRQLDGVLCNVQPVATSCYWRVKQA